MVPRIISYSTYGFDKLRVRVMVLAFKATFNNVLFISWRSVLLMEETGVHGENHRPNKFRPYQILLDFVKKKKKLILKCFECEYVIVYFLSMN